MTDPYGELGAPLALAALLCILAAIGVFAWQVALTVTVACIIVILVLQADIIRR